MDRDVPATPRIWSRWLAVAAAGEDAMWTGSLGRLSLAHRPYLRSTAGRNDNAGQDIATSARTPPQTLTLPPHRSYSRARQSRSCAVSENGRSHDHYRYTPVFTHADDSRVSIAIMPSATQHRFGMDFLLQSLPPVHWNISNGRSKLNCTIV